MARVFGELAIFRVTDPPSSHSFGSPNVAILKLIETVQDTICFCSFHFVAMIKVIDYSFQIEFIGCLVMIFLLGMGWDNLFNDYYEMYSRLLRCWGWLFFPMIINWLLVSRGTESFTKKYLKQKHEARWPASREIYIYIFTLASPTI